MQGDRDVRLVSASRQIKACCKVNKPEAPSKHGNAVIDMENRCKRAVKAGKYVSPERSDKEGWLPRASPGAEV